MFISHKAGEWQARHCGHPFGTPAELCFHGEPLIQDCQFYIDDLGPKQTLLHERRVYQQRGMDIVKETGFLPFGGQPGFEKVTRYGVNYARVTFDLLWPRNGQVQRHLGVGGLFLPGRWRTFFCIPPVQHLREGAEPAYFPIEQPSAGQEKVMIGHWHRPPLALVFHRQDGVRLEIGAGGDVWRWQKSLGAGPEHGSYKIIAEPDGLRFIREPLMTCTPYSPSGRRYRFQWYMAWDQQPKSRKSQPDAEHEIHLEQPSLPNDGCRLETPETSASPIRTGQPCWLCSATVNILKRNVRQLAAQNEPSSLTIRQLDPGYCCDASHLQRGNKEILHHWDMDAILDLANWIRRQLGNEWRIQIPPTELNAALPSFSRLFEKEK